MMKARRGSDRHVHGRGFKEIHPVSKEIQGNEQSSKVLRSKGMALAESPEYNSSFQNRTLG